MYLIPMSLWILWAFPSQFIQDHGEKFHETSFLHKSLSKKTWWVPFSTTLIEQGSSMVLFSKDWATFARENELQEGDTLIFVLNVQSVSFSRCTCFDLPSKKEKHRMLEWE